MRIITIILLLISLSSDGQYSLDTMTKMKAWTNTSMDFSTPLWCRGTNGEYLKILFINHYKNGNTTTPDSLEVERIDLTNHTSSKKQIGQLSSSSALWQWIQDSLGRVFIGFNTNGRIVWCFDFRDSIKAIKIGNCFPDGQALAYSMSIATNGDIILGSSSGGTWVSAINKNTLAVTQYSEVDSVQQYVLSVMADSNWIYASCGQSHGITFYVIDRSNGNKAKIFTSYNLFNLKVSSNGHCYVNFFTDTLSGTWQLNGWTDTTRIASYNGFQRLDYTQVNNTNAPNPSTAAGFINDATSQYYFSLNNASLYDSVSITLDSVRNNIRHIFSLPGHIYYVGDFYGTYYDYKIASDTSIPLGSTGFNIWSSCPINDSLVYIGSYPSAALQVFNKNKFWTAQKQTAGISINTNPSLLGFFKSQTAANFHEPHALIKNGKYIVSAGNVIRVGNSTSIATYDADSSVKLWGYDYNKIVDNLNLSSLANWHDKVLFSTNGTGAKIYVYKPSTNQMVDSISFGGISNYGSLYVAGETLIGVTPTIIYKYNLAKKVLVRSLTYSSITASFQMSDGTIVLEMNGTPPSFWNFKKLPYSYTYFQEANNKLYTIDAQNIVRINGITGDNTYPTNTPFNRYKFIKKILNLN